MPILLGPSIGVGGLRRTERTSADVATRRGEFNRPAR